MEINYFPITKGKSCYTPLLKLDTIWLPLYIILHAVFISNYCVSNMIPFSLWGKLFHVCTLQHVLLVINTITRKTSRPPFTISLFDFVFPVKTWFSSCINYSNSKLDPSTSRLWSSRTQWILLSWKCNFLKNFYVPSTVPFLYPWYWLSLLETNKCNLEDLVLQLEFHRNINFLITVRNIKYMAIVCYKI